MPTAGRFTRRGGFTLIELLVVIAIIAILAAILFPVFAQARNKARQAVGTSNAKQVCLSILMYVQDYDESFVRAGRDCQTDTNGVPNQCGPDTWQNVLQPYIKAAGVMNSPGDGSTSKTFAKATDKNLSLLYNDMLSHTTGTFSGADGTVYSDANESIASAGISLAAVNAPADCVALAEGHGGWDKITGNGIDPNTLPPDWTGSKDIQNKWHLEQDISTKCTSELTGVDYGGGWGDSGQTKGVPFYNGGGIVAYTDGHVKYVRMVDGKGNPTLCSTLPWAKTIDPLQRGANKDGCSNPDNLPGVGAANWL